MYIYRNFNILVSRTYTSHRNSALAAAVFCNIFFGANASNQNTMKPQVLIIGAGATGIAAAVKLSKLGLDFKILEAENRIGGRINSVFFGESTIDLGAQWCHGEQGNIVYQYVKDFDLLAPSFNTYRDNTFYESTGRVLEKDFTDRLAMLFAESYDGEFVQDTKDSFGEVFSKFYLSETQKEFRGNTELLQSATNLLQWFHKFTLCYNACPSWFDLSSSGLLEYEECEGDPILNWKDKGFKMILDVIMNKYPHPSKAVPIEKHILFNKCVRRIDWHSKDSVVVECEDGEIYKADHVIVTVSLGVLKDQYKSLFTPQLPAFKQNAIEGLSIGSVDKIFLKFSKRWWPEDCKGFSLVWTEQDIKELRNSSIEGIDLAHNSWLENVFGFYPIDSERTTLLGWVVGEKIADFERLTDDIVEEACMLLLNKFLGRMYEIPRPTNVLCSRWLSNPHQRGCYSYRSLATERYRTCAADLAEVICAQDELRTPRLLFGGEATHPRFYSTVHGAIESGFREAERIVKFYKKNSTPLHSQL